MLAQRMQSFGNSGTAAARSAAKAAAAAGTTVLDLSAGEVSADLAPTLYRGALNALEQGVTRYSDTIGMPELREAIAAKLTSETWQIWSADEIAVTAGAKQALFNAAMTLLNPGDEVLIPMPYWSTFPAQVTMAGAKPVFVDTRRTQYLPSIQALRDASSPATRAIIINTPNNPTGAVYSRECLLAIAQFAIENQLWVIFDECYGELTHAPHIHHSIVGLAPELRSRLVIVNAFSKQLAITGWRIGYMAGPAPLIKAVRALQSHTTSNPNVIAQHAVLEHLRSGSGHFVADLREQLLRARHEGLTILAELERVPDPNAQGGFYFYLDLSNLLAPIGADESLRTADDVAARLITRAGVAGVSGVAFGDPAGLRLSYGVSAEQLRSGLPRLVRELNSIR
ncbi:aminotransferase class I/II-fold pyridoxal phosphate-dependent enzyme [Steroidobacter sp. S1-65]|uniref:Aminotransferase class I/II-fold pyridoxal phosphate-dependent enzyme n=1 Tax=Steroidobacter gossypii TaxID=2805490 RepID=A0ABS1WYA8_9GAMM|nr:aminotransferase class I/II-fold pyridoxal phosphate-dependent enzyme [Steroidobacter gossypii]MBM0105964.1 aminotransferase class I/II-fold pyridoxal phosphate-dependent enzyme [Steroidobacter gossypii]